MTIQELINIASQYNPDTQVHVAIQHMVRPIDKIVPCVDMDTNEANMVIYTEE